MEQILEKGVDSVLVLSKLSLFVSVVFSLLGSTRAKYTVQLGQSNNILYTVSHQQIKPWSLLSKGNKSKSWEKVWAN